jgi:flagellar hook assembly protein FlgD
VTLAIFDVSGRLVRELVSGASFEAGQHEVRWDGRDARGAVSSTGVYYVQMSAPGYRATEKLVLLK